MQGKRNWYFREEHVFLGISGVIGFCRKAGIRTKKIKADYEATPYHSLSKLGKRIIYVHVLAKQEKVYYEIGRKKTLFMKSTFQWTNQVLDQLCLHIKTAYLPKKEAPLILQVEDYPDSFVLIAPCLRKDVESDFKLKEKKAEKKAVACLGEKEVKRRLKEVEK